MIFERLNGWRRIWVVTSVLSLAVAVGLSAFVWQTVETVEQCIYAKTESRRPDANQLQWMVERGKISEAEAKEHNEIADRIFQKEIEEAPGHCRESVKGQRIQAVLLLTYWLAFIGVTYLFGWAIGWIARGFTRKNNEQ